MQFTVHSKSRTPLKKPTLEITKHNRFKKERVKNIDKEKHRYEVKLVLTKVQLEDMGNYELKIHDKITDQTFHPSLNMTLFVNSKPNVSLEADNPSGFYYDNENVQTIGTCGIISYPLEETT